MKRKLLPVLAARLQFDIRRIETWLCDTVGLKAGRKRNMYHMWWNEQLLPPIDHETHDSLGYCPTYERLFYYVSSVGTTDAVRPVLLGRPSMRLFHCRIGFLVDRLNTLLCNYAHCIFARFSSQSLRERYWCYRYVFFF